MINRLVELEPGQRCDQGVEVEEEQWLSYLQALVSVQQCLLPQQSQIKVLRLIFMRFSRKICAELYERTILDLDKTSAPIGALEVKLNALLGNYDIPTTDQRTDGTDRVIGRSFTYNNGMLIVNKDQL